MADYKEDYSNASSRYALGNFDNRSNEGRYRRSREREKRHGEDWKKHKVDLNKVVDHFAPDGNVIQSGVKMRYTGKKYEVIADMAGGYLRIYDKEARHYVRLDGTPGNNKETHFKIKKREEM